MEINNQNKRRPGVSYQSISWLPNMFKGFLSSMTHRMNILDALIQRGFYVFPKIATADLWKLFDKVILTPFSLSS